MHYVRTILPQACIPLGDLDLGYSMVGNFFGEGAFLATHHSSQDRATARAPVANIYSAGRPSTACEVNDSSHLSEFV